VIKFRLKTEHRARYALAAASGILLALAFPSYNIAGLAWIAPGLLLFAALGTTPGRAFRIGYIGGFAYYLCTLTWLLHIPVVFLPILGWIALSAFLALYTALFVWIGWKLFGTVPLARVPWARELLRGFMASGWRHRNIWAVKCAAVWVALEMTISRFLSGFPWDLLGVSQYKLLPLIQIASFTGVYGVSFLIVWFSVALLMTGVALYQTPMRRTAWLREIAVPLIAIAILIAWGMRIIRTTPQPEHTTKMALIQPSIPQTLIWDERENANRFRQLLALSRQALTNQPDILVWPEAALPNMLRHDEDTANAVIELSREHKTWTILGSDDAELRPGGAFPRDVDYFNSAFAVSPDGKLTAMYRKRRLVIFGEYVPFVKQLPFMKYLSPAGEAGFTPGTKPIPFNLESLSVIASVLICFEDTFPHVVREYVEPNTDILVNLTNNGWFGESAAQWQHAATAVFRAVENRIPLVRCANNGLTCWVDSVGAMHEVYFSNSKDIYQAGFKIVNVPVLAAGQTRALSFYTRHGDVFGWSCFGLTTLNLLARYIRLGLRRNVPETKPLAPQT
jgi:apolipoprotein N-acyltransferase